MIVDPNNPDRVFFDTFEVWLASSTGTAWYDLTCGYNGTSVANHVVHVDQHALAFVNGSSDIPSGGQRRWGSRHHQCQHRDPEHRPPDVDQPRCRHQCHRVLLRRHQRQLCHLGDSLRRGRRSRQRTQLGDVYRLPQPGGAVADGPGRRWLLRVDRSDGHGFDPGSRHDHIDNGWRERRSAIPDRFAGLHLRHLGECHRPGRVGLKHHDGRQQHRHLDHPRHPDRWSRPRAAAPR